MLDKYCLLQLKLRQKKNIVLGLKQKKFNRVLSVKLFYLIYIKSIVYTTLYLT